MTTAVVVGSGPNGLAGAAKLALAGVDVTVIEAAHEVGGGMRTSRLFDDLLVDDCSAIHMLAADSAAHLELGLVDYGLRWCSAPIDMVHPLDDGSAAVLHRSIDETARGLGSDGARWSRLFEPLTERFGDLADEVFQPVLHLPRHPLLLARFGVGAVAPAALLARWFRTGDARALWAGAAAHAIQPLGRPLTSAAGLMLLAAGHRNGWVVAAGGSQSIADALVASITAHGGSIETGRTVTSIRELGDPDIVLLDTTPLAAAELLAGALPPRIERAYRGFRHGAAAFKVDFAVDGGVPWTSLEARSASTVHVGGSLEQIAAAERDVNVGRMPQRPFVLVCQQYLADPQRSNGDVHPVWSYAHVPAGFIGDATDLIIDQIERFAPGFRDRIVGVAVRSATEMARYNPNCVGGDIAGGATSPWQMVARPRLSPNPYATGISGVYLCSSSTPPGAGAHGMCGTNAAARALAALDVGPVAGADGE